MRRTRVAKFSILFLYAFGSFGAAQFVSGNRIKGRKVASSFDCWSEMNFLKFVVRKNFIKLFQFNSIHLISTNLFVDIL